MSSVQPPHDPNQQARPAWQPPANDQPPFPQAGTPHPSAAGQFQPWQGQAPQRPQPGGEDRTWAILAHLSSPIATVVSAGWLSVVGPLVVWFLKKDNSPYVRRASAGAFNFTLAMWLTSVIGWILTITVIGAIIGIPMIILGMLGPIVLGIVGAVKAGGGEEFRYPWQLPVLS